MVYDATHRVITISGPLFGGGDRWTSRLRLITSVGAPAPTQAMCDALEAPLRTWFTSTSSTFHTTHGIDLIKLNRVGVDGKIPALDPVLVKVPATAINGSYSTNGSWPAQCSLALSMYTIRPRGLAHLGRIYPPPSGIPLSGDGTMTAAIVLQWMGTFRTLLNSINAISGLGGVGIFSKVGAGASEYVTGVRAGRIIDTHRSRRSALPENYQVLPL